jgi:hypothetical protein
MPKVLSLLWISFILSSSCYTQLNVGGLHANFGVDADTRAASMKYGPVSGNNSTDDWFAPSGNAGRGVLDTSNAAYFKSQLQSNKNICFTKNMAVPLFSPIKNILWLDAIYMRDYIAATGSDSTAFGSSAKNGDDPRNWNGTATNIPGKTDFVDAFAHFRRDGKRVKDSLWFFTGISTLATQGERYFDVELFKNNVTYNPITGAFTSSGTSFGHTEWIFDKFGNIIQTGDLIVAVSYSGGAPVIDVRIWVSKQTFNTVIPALFRFGVNFDSSIPGGVAGYATILSKAGATAFGSGIGNYSNTAANDVTYSTPWGTNSKGAGWTPNYESLQFVEIGLNFTRIGIDPALYADLGKTACDRIFHSIFFKSRSSNSFSANLQDFAGPINFYVPALNFTLTNDTLSCKEAVGTIAIHNTYSLGVYQWSTADGNILDANDDSTTIRIDKSGNYMLVSSLAEGCPAMRFDNVVVPVDSLPPVASSDLGLNATGALELLGGDTAASNVMTPFGRSKGLKWEWSGPNGFTAYTQNAPINSSWAWGSYHLELTEERNGCRAASTLEVSFSKATIGQAEEITQPLMDDKVSIIQNAASKRMFVVTNRETSINGRIAMYNTAGQLLNEKNIEFTKGQNKIELPSISTNQLKVVAVYIGNKLALSRKVSF